MPFLSASGVSPYNKIRGGGSALVVPFNFENALKFDGVNDFVSISSASITDPITMSWWQKTANSSVPFANNGLEYIQTQAGLNRIVGYIDNIAIWTHTYTPSTDWQHFMLVYDGTVARAYINGVQSTTGARAATAGRTFTLNIIGSYTSGGSGASAVVFDEMAIWNKTGTLQNAVDLYNSGDGALASDVISGPIVHYSLNETGAATTAADSSGNGKNGTLNNFALPGAWVPHNPAFNFENALEFDGVNDNVTFSNITLGTNATHSFWFKINSYNTDVMWGNASNNGINFPRIFTTSSFRVGDERGSKGFFTVANFNDSSWHHCVLTKSGTNFKVYLDGTESTSGTQVITATITLNKSGTTYGFFDGLYDDVNLWNAHTATAAEVSALYNGGAGQYSEEVIPSPTLHWKLNETGTATTAVDSSGNGNNGTLNNFPTSGMWVAHDADVRAWISSGSITNQTEIAAVNQFALNLKGIGNTTNNSDVWSSLHWINLVSATSLAASLNDLKGGYNLTGYNSPTWANTGVKGNNNNMYLQTDYVANDDGSVLNSNSFGIALRSAATSTQDSIMGTRVGSNPYNVIHHAGGLRYSGNNSTYSSKSDGLWPSGTIINNRVASSEFKVWIDGSLYHTFTASSSSMTTVGMVLFAQVIDDGSANGTANFFSNAEFTVAFEGMGLTDNQITDLNDAINTLNANIIPGGR